MISECARPRSFSRVMLATLVLLYLFLLLQFEHETPKSSVESSLEDFLKENPKSHLRHSSNNRGTPPTSKNGLDIRLNQTIGGQEEWHGIEQPSKKLKLQEKLDEIFISSGKPYNGNLWELSDYIPPWMKEYFSWHQAERRKLTESNWESHRLLVMQCLKGSDTKCGGTADRLKPFVFVLREAYESKRLLFIHWTLPAQIEEFLVPPEGGIDWRAPSWLREIIYDLSYGRRMYKAALMKDARNASVGLLRTRIQSITGAAEFYDAELQPNESNFGEVYHDVWRIFFTPSQQVRQMIEKEIDEMGLVPGQYAAAHLRALYARVQDRPASLVTEWTENALNCASQLRPGGPFFFASDLSEATDVAVSYGKMKSTKVVSRKHSSRPLHFDRAENVDNREPNEFYDTFIDLYLMGMGRCVAYNRGGFGTWALLIGYDPTCGFNQKTSQLGIANICNWTVPQLRKSGMQHRKAPLFLNPL